MDFQPASVFWDQLGYYERMSVVTRARKSWRKLGGISKRGRPMLEKRIADMTAPERASIEAVLMRLPRGN